MRHRFQILNDPRFHLVYGEKRRFQEGPEPIKVRLNREGFILEEGIKKKVRVFPGMLLATHPSMLKGDLHSSIYGVIKDINHLSIFIDAVEREETDPVLEFHDILAEGKRGEELILQIKQMGVNTRSLGQKTKTLIINGLNPDPGVTWAEPMLQSHASSFELGIKLHSRLARAERIILAVPKGANVSYDGVEIVHVEAKYPNSVNQLLMREVTGKENPADVAVVGLHNIWSLGRVGFTGLPLMHTVLTVGSATKWGNYIVKNGIIISQILDFAKVELNNGDTILRGGPLRGECLDSTERSATKGTTGVFVVEAGTVPLMEGHSPCVNCGACVQVCPAYINPSTLSRYSEFANYNACLEEHSTSCMECGLCGYVCIARRPVLQYIRLANAKIKEMEEFVYVNPEEKTSDETIENNK